MSEKKSVNDKIIEALDLASEIKSEYTPPIEGKVIEGEIIEMEQPSSDLDSDYDQVRTNLKSLIAQGQVAVDGILNIASEGEQPRAYEVASQLLKNLVEANKELLDVHKQIKEIESKDDTPKQVHTHNSLYVGSTKELQKLLGGRKMNSDNDDDKRET